MIDDEMAKLVSDYYDVHSSIKSLEEHKSDLYRQLNERAKEFWEDNEMNRPVKYVIITDESLTEPLDKYLDKMYPEWEIMDMVEEDDNHYGIFMRRKPEYVDSTFENDEYKFSRSVVTPAPKIDMYRLKNERPEMFTEISKTKVVHEIDDERLKKYLEQHPEDTQLLDQYNSAGLPSSRIKVTKKK